MAKPVDLAYSKRAIDRAGELLRNGKYDLFEYDDATTKLEHWRACHAYALAKAGMGLRSMVDTAGYTPLVSQRLKRARTIAEKLRREPQMKLSTMRDIGGCRAVLPDLSAVRAVEERILSARPGGSQPVIIDYVDNPRDTGYRAVHAIVTYDDRKIEIQLKTELQHRWATLVERIGVRIGFDLKSGAGPDVWLSALRAFADVAALAEAGIVAPDEQVAAADALWGAAVDSLKLRPEGTADDDR
jgi:hypothetical protein